MSAFKHFIALALLLVGVLAWADEPIDITINVKGIGESTLKNNRDRLTAASP